jgi:hypothetical protein
MADEEDKNNIRVEDRRFFDREGNPVQQESPQEPKVATEEKGTPRQKHSTVPPKIDFPSFLFLYLQTALVHLGELEDPIQRKVVENMEAARQTIDILDMLKEKTKGNLSTEEDQYFETALFDLRMRYIQKAKIIR